MTMTQTGHHAGSRRYRSHGRAGDRMATHPDVTRMRSALAGAARRVLASDVLLPETRPAIDFLRWLGAGHFEPLGYAEYAVVSDPGRPRAEVVAGTTLGLLADHPDGFFAAPRRGDDRVVVVSKDDRPGQADGLLDYVGVRLRDASGRVTSELRFVGRFTERADAVPPLAIPLVRDRARLALHLAAGPRAAERLLDVIPRDELLAATADELASVLEGLAAPDAPAALRLFIRPDAYGRHLTCQVFLPRERCTPGALRGIRETLLEATDGEALREETRLTPAGTARLTLVVRPADPIWQLDIDLGELQTALACCIETWDERVALLRCDCTSAR